MIIRSILLFTLWCTAGCAAELEATHPEMASRLGALPRVPEAPRPPAFPPELRGLTFRTRAVLVGGDPRMDERAQHCADNFDRWMGAAGWIPIRDPAAMPDLDIDEYCMVHLSAAVHGSLMELHHPASENVAIAVTHAGAPIVSVPRGPADYACLSNGTPQEVARDCEARSELWAQQNILETLIASPQLRALAQQLHPQPAR